MKSNPELPSVMLNQEISVLLAIVLISGWVIGHKVVVEVVIAAHSNKENAPSKCLCSINRPKIVCNLIKSVLEVMYLLIKWYSAHLIKANTQKLPTGNCRKMLVI